MIKNKIVLFAALISMVSAFSHAAVTQVTQTLNISADIQAPPGGAFDVQPLAGSWPVGSLAFTYNASSKSFSSPASIGFKVKSTADVTAALTAPAVLAAGLARIPVLVKITATSANGATLTSLSQSSQTIYSIAAQATTPAYATYTIDLVASTTGMLDANGTAIAAASGVPAPGSYSGSVPLVFESNI